MHLPHPCDLRRRHRHLLFTCLAFSKTRSCCILKCTSCNVSLVTGSLMTAGRFGTVAIFVSSATAMGSWVQRASGLLPPDEVTGTGTGTGTGAGTGTGTGTGAVTAATAAISAPSFDRRDF